jgi:hypothetical protein
MRARHPCLPSSAHMRPRGSPSGWPCWSLGFCRIRFLYQSHQGSGISGRLVASPSGISLEEGAAAAAGLLVADAALGDVPSLSVVRTKALLAKVLLSLSQDHSGLRKIPFAPCHKGKSFVSRISSFPMTKSRLSRRVSKHRFQRSFAASNKQYSGLALLRIRRATLACRPRRASSDPYE